MTNDQPPFFMSGCNVRAYDDGQHIGLDFMNRSYETRSVVVHRMCIATILGVLQSEIQAGAVIPINQANLRSGAEFRLTSFAIRKLPSGFSRLTFYLEPTKGSTVIAEITLNESDVNCLIFDLFRYAS